MAVTTDTKAVHKFWIAGFAYGLVLTVFGVMLAGAGHGTYILLGMASAPFSFFGVIFSVIVPPLMWGALAGLLAERRQTLLVALAVHYFSLLLIPFSEDFGESKYLVKAMEDYPAVLISSVAFYAVGQVLFWFYWFKVKTKHS